LKRASRYTRLLREEAEALMHLVGREDCELSILLTGDRRMKQLNINYRFLARPTDVLSFAQIEEGESDAFPAAPGEYRPPDAKPLGDVVISLETAARQAREMRQSTSQRLRTLLVHGFLHLLGYDHERSKSDAAAMFGYQDKLEAALEEAVKTAQTAPGQA
jgi:rRNA maturation RNase YbeY